MRNVYINIDMHNEIQFESKLCLDLKNKKLQSMTCVELS